MKESVRRRLLFWSLPVVAVLLALVLLLRPQPVAVDLAVVERGPLQVATSDEGETRVRDVYVVSAPVTGLMLRIDLEPGDEVIAAETIVAHIQPTDPIVLDVRTEAEAKASMQAAIAAREYGEAEVERANSELEFARAEFVRFQGLAEGETISASELDDAKRRERTATAALAEAKAQLAVRMYELERARARLLPVSEAREQREGCDCIHVYSPVSGQVLRRLQESEGVIDAGTPLLEIGDPRDLEVVVDLLSSEAVKVAPGQRVVIEAWGGDADINGVVRRVEPLGFTKVSALGIEEQRVNVIIDLTDSPELWSSLGHGYRVEPRIILWEADNVLKTPLGALFREGGDWAVFVEEGGRAVLRSIEIGRENSLEVEVAAGLDPGERVVLHPGDRVGEGVRISQRRL